MALRDEAVDLLQRLLRLDTSNPPGNETPAAELLRAYLEANGVACVLVARDPVRANLIARLPGTAGGPSLMLLGNTDVGPAVATDCTRPPFGGELDADGYVWGRGAVDMKNEVATRAVAIHTSRAAAGAARASCCSSPSRRGDGRKAPACGGWSRRGPTSPRTT